MCQWLGLRDRSGSSPDGYFFSEMCEIKPQCSCSGLTFRMVAMKCNNYPLLQLQNTNTYTKCNKYFPLQSFEKDFQSSIICFCSHEVPWYFQNSIWKCKNWNSSNSFSVLKSMFNCQIIFFQFFVIDQVDIRSY